LDTNIWVASIKWQGTPYRLRILAQTFTFTSVTSLPILVEVARVLREYFGLSDEQTYEWFCQIGECSQVVTPTQALNVVLNDPDDNKFIECAVAGDVSYIVSRDADLLRLRQYQQIQIVDDKVFWEVLIESD
jgi:putative PIN family toxin of toxin-antitoxin system